MWLVNFFKWLWDGIKSLFSYIVSIPGLVIAGAASIYSGVSTIISQLSSTSTFVQGISTAGDSAVSSVAGFVTQGGDFLQLFVYLLSVDLLFSTALAFLTLLITLAFVFITFFLVAVPAFILYYYSLKVAAFIATVMFPSNFLPAAIKDFGSFKGTNFHRLIGGQFIIQNDYERKAGT